MGADNNIYSFPGGSAESGNRPIDDHTQKTINGENELQNSICRHPSNILKSIENNERVNQLQLINELGEYGLSLVKKIEIYENTDNLNDENTKFNNDAIKDVMFNFFKEVYQSKYTKISAEELEIRARMMIGILGDPGKNKEKWMKFTALAKDYYENRKNELAQKAYTPVTK